MEKDIYVLHEKLEEYIRNNILSSHLIRMFSLQFKRLLNFMDENSIKFYNKEVGKKYVAFRALPGNNKRKSEKAHNYERRYITLLNGMMRASG